ncbi:hypothetical protein [Amycolatopsis sp. cmx-4-54]|uniref:hypothetical protein n=1 Tax=Amycolatopsis sp. cmx-4-54 TaxID=2790936 RepID=UPI00397C92BE
MEVTTKATLSEMTGVGDDLKRVSDLAFARICHSYDRELLDSIEKQARQLAQEFFPEHDASSEERFLGLRHLREAQRRIPEVDQLMTDSRRLEALSELAETELAPYPVARASAHINFYRPGEVPIEYHTDGAAMVELIPLAATGTTNGGGTMVYRGAPEDGEYRLARGQAFRCDELERIPQDTTHSVLMQGRRLLHRAESFPDGERLTLVFALEAVTEPWKDDNTLMRLLLDDPLETVLDDWVSQARRRADLYMQTRRPNAMAGTDDGGVATR